MADTPADIIIDIARLTPPSHALDTTAGLWPLAQVNRHWRSVIKETRKLWTRLRFDPVSPNPARRNYEMRIAREALSLSGGLPLSISYRDSPHNQHDIGSVWLIHMLTVQSPRWKSARLRFHLSTHFVVLDRIRSSIGALERLQIQTLFTTAPTAVLQSQNLTFSVAPSLREVSLAHNTNFIQMQFPYGQLAIYRELDGGPDSVAPRPHQYLLPLIPNVENLVLAWCDADGGGNQQFPLPAVRTLCVNGADVLDLIASAPFLHTLQIVDGEADNIGQIIPLNHRSNYNLRSLTLHLIDNLDGANLVPVLRQISTLQYLQIFAYEYDKIFIRCLEAGGQDPQCLLKGLTSLTVTCTGDSRGQFDQQSLDRMLHNRLGRDGFGTFFLSIRQNPPRPLPALTPQLIATIGQKRRLGCRIFIEFGVPKLHDGISRYLSSHSIQWKL